MNGTTAVIRSDEAGALRQMLAKLPPEQRQVVELAYFAGLSQAEIAETLRLPVGTVKGCVRLGLKKLRAATESDSSMVSPVVAV